MTSASWRTRPRTLRTVCPRGDVLVHHDKLPKFDRDKPVWTFYSRGFSDEVLNYMAPRWPLDFGAE